MGADFVPFPRYDFAPVSAVPEFAPVTPPADTKAAATVPADKAMADLMEALRIGLDEEILETILSGMKSPRLTPKARPISLRDLHAPESPAPPESSDPKAPGIVVTRVGEVVQKVTVECPCGERISLDCVY
jgi:hypothetical protein